MIDDDIWIFLVYFGHFWYDNGIFYTANVSLLGAWMGVITYREKHIHPTTRPKTASDSANSGLISGRVDY